MRKSDRFDKIAIERQRGPYGAGYSGYELDVICASGDVVVVLKGKYLRFTCLTVE